MKLKHNMKLLVYEHYQVKDMKLKHDINCWYMNTTK